MKVGQKVKVLKDGSLYSQFHVGQVVKFEERTDGFKMWFSGRDANVMPLQLLYPHQYAIIEHEIIPEETIEYYDQEPDKRFVVSTFFEDRRELVGSYDTIEEAQKNATQFWWEIYDRVVGKEVKWS